MIKNIIKLPQSVANRIAAGEVIERPASMLKELLENAIDSGASNIEVSVEEAGIKSMIVEDDGSGIRFNELPLAITHHATSKIHSIEDLDSIYTLGFRGEALASISDVTNLEIVSKSVEESNGGKIVVEGGKIIEHKPAAASQGTKIIAKNLFFNIPARYKFLKHISREFFLVKEVFDMEALVQPQISMKLKNNGKVVSSYIKVDTLKERIENYLSDNNVFRNLIEIEIERDDVSIYGLFSNSKISQSIRKNNFIFLNNRPIENRVLAYAIKNAYSNAIPKERYPFFFLYINIDSSKIDVNVHPSKKEVRIKNEREISGILYNTIVNNINSGSNLDSVNIEVDIDKDITPTFPIQNNNYNTYNTSNYNTESSNEKKYDNTNYSNNNYAQYDLNVENNDNIIEENNTNKEINLNSNNFSTNNIEFGEYTRAIGQVFSSYIVAERGGEMYIIDQHAAYERLNYERIYKTLMSKKIEYEKLLIPCEIEYRDYEIDILNASKESIESLGIKFEANSKHSIIIEDIPIYIPRNQKIEKIIKDILDIYINKGDNNNLEKVIKHTCSTISCKYSPKAGDKLSNSDMQTLLDLLEEENILTNCPHGRPFVLRLSKEYLDKKFFR
ncbi:DNA mismatch repair endonuclease MutL [Brachyspira hampsonii]|uniref:DNA mismatch repair protein MutL n=1 Tax=Brachyspira hampsonii TaxID=1287055 RepID=A0AAC9TV33_9SPIR|nr:DNA mismatch repair endonuclease MutL [Brachyspira hampsonii]ASJ22443.1 DNA mismatch repair protein MutL [Brachyspira hampsonii]ELV05243.1 D mismatch repair protein [Brachyspira hampsonii 30599]MBW5381336.1 DNA mismatch repair endonuclease MutL [Brachyspira hampsonii]OEJ16967.1 DNA mismatch repair protein MutL [Brachyspira hampsonii]